MAELGLNDHHQNEVINYMRFARSKRGLRLKTVDSCFQDLKDSRYHEEGIIIKQKPEESKTLLPRINPEASVKLCIKYV
uniref:Leucine zipper transcription factor-like protein 1 n=1 Tax=Terrapene triunguis TaxID=2587831 RepID=A0A674K4F0_9SAUR